NGMHAVTALAGASVAAVAVGLLVATPSTASPAPAYCVTSTSTASVTYGGASYTALPTPTVTPSPYSPGSGCGSQGSGGHPRTKVCHVAALGDLQDDAPNIYAAAQECNGGGTVILDEDYYVRTPLDLRGLSHVDLQITGNISFWDNVTYWQSEMFFWTYQNATSQWVVGGEDVNIYGYGVGILDGRGQAWYDAYAANALIKRPILLVLSALNGGVVSGLNMRFSGQWYNFVANSSNVIYDGITIEGASTSSHVAKNTDGWDTYRSDSVVIQNSVINNGDDCVSFKPNSTNVVVQGLVCNGSHGISVGSLGQYKLEYDVVENIYVYNISMSNASDGARIKVWPGLQSALSTDLQGGGGSGHVRNVTYDTFYNYNNDYIIELTQCYGQSNLTLCNEYPSSLTISDVHFRNFWGTASTKYKPVVGTLVCSSPTVCSDIYATNITIPAQTGATAAEWRCTNVDESNLEVNCVAGV
ncbi:hypothetical protein HK405_009135, partial [Cladochytrium tenue]